MIFYIKENEFSQEPKEGFSKIDVPALKFSETLMPFLHGFNFFLHELDINVFIDMLNGYRSEDHAHAGIYINGQEYGVKLESRGRYTVDNVWVVEGIA